MVGAPLPCSPHSALARVLLPRRPRMLVLPLVLLCPLAVWAANISIPSTWRNTTSFFTRDDRISLAQDAIDQFIKLGFPSGSMASAVSQHTVLYVDTILPMLWAIARKDILAASQDNKAYVTGELDALIRNDSWWTDDPEYSESYWLWSAYASACIDAYKAYGGETYVDKAIELWKTVQASQVVSQDGYGNSSSLMCNKSTIAASVAAQEWTINAQDTGSFLIVSAALAELVSSNSAFFDAAALATQSWLSFWTSLSYQQGCVVGQVIAFPNSCNVEFGSQPEVDCSTYITAGVSVFAGLQKNASIQERLSSQIMSFMRSPAIPATGVINESVVSESMSDDSASYGLASKYDVMFPLVEVWNRSVSQAPELIPLLEAFVNVQINAMMANATFAGSNLYASSWTGPPTRKYSTNGMSGAIAALVAGIGPIPPSPSAIQVSSSSMPAQSGLTSAPDTNHHYHSIAHGAAVGIGVAGALVSLLLGGSAFYFCRRRRQRRDAMAMQAVPNEATVLGVSNQEIFLSIHKKETDATSISRAMQQKQRRIQQRAVATAEDAPTPPTEATLALEPEPSTAPVPDDVRQLMRRVSLQLAPSAQGAELRRRLEELGPVPEVIQALQEMLRSQSIEEDNLPQYEEGSRRDQ